MNGKRGAPYGNTNALKHGRYAHSGIPLITDREEAVFREMLLENTPKLIGWTKKLCWELGESMLDETDMKVYGKKLTQLVDMFIRMIKLRGLLEELGGECPPDEQFEYGYKETMERVTERLAKEEADKQNREGKKGMG